MSNRRSSTEQEGLRFFGTVTASISHEIRNCMAAASENAGLLQDLCLMAGKGKTVDPQRFKDISQKIVLQIKRADDIIRKMNRFAHSVDEAVGTVDLRELVVLVADLSRRIAERRGVCLEVAEPKGPAEVRTNPYVLENLLWLCIEFSMGAAGEGRKVMLAAAGTSFGGEIRLSRLEGFREAVITFPTEREKSMIEELKCGFRVDAKAGEIMITLPGDIRAA